jgi:16S rRNA (cytosine967-C5)-methyltransferase
MHTSSLLGHTQELLGIIRDSKKPADAIIDTFFRSHKYLGSHDRRFIAETTYGVLRNLRKCEFMLAAAVREREEVLSEEDRVLLLVAAYLSLQGKMLDASKEAVSSKLKNSDLREIAGKIIYTFMQPTDLSAESGPSRIGIEYSFPDWMVNKFIELYGENETEKICASLNEQAPITLRVNTLKTTIEQCRADLDKQGVATTRTPLSPFGLNLTKRINVFSLPVFRDGWFEVQDEGSQLLPLLIDPKPNIKLLDVCAGAGGKTLEFAALMKNRGEIFATDINLFRLEELRKRLKRAGAQNVRVIDIQAVEDLEERYAGFFDIVFVDAPCSGLGTVRRNPGMKWMVTEQTVDEVSEKQKAILHSSAALVKPGGRLVYATCTLLRQENEEVIENLLKQHLEFNLVDINELLQKCPPLVQNKTRVSTNSFLKLIPHIDGTDGFFCAVMERRPVR